MHLLYIAANIFFDLPGVRISGSRSLQDAGGLTPEQEDMLLAAHTKLMSKMQQLLDRRDSMQGLRAVTRIQLAALYSCSAT